MIGLLTNVVRFGGGRQRFFFLGRGQHLLAKIRKPRLPRSHEILMFVILQKGAKLKPSCNPNLHRPIVLLVENQNNKCNSGIAAGGLGGGGPKSEID